MNLKKTVTLLALATVVGTAAQVRAQSATATPPLSYGVTEVLKLEQAKVSDDTIVAYINTAGNSYGLDADQIIYLKQQGVSSVVLSAMLAQGRAGVAPAVPTASAPVTPAAAPAPQYEASAPVPVPASPAPTVTYVQTVPTTYYYSDPSPYYYSYPYYYPWYAPVGVSVGFGWGGGWHGGGAWHGGGGWHGGHR